MGIEAVPAVMKPAIEARPNHPRARVKLGVERAKLLAQALECYPGVLVFPGWVVPTDAAAEEDRAWTAADVKVGCYTQLESALRKSGRSSRRHPPGGG